jgi:hypothetical protein
MDCTQVVPHRFLAFFIGCSLILTACSPAVYKKPAEDFRNATASLKQTYFIELELSNKARIEREDLEDQIVIWKSKIKIASSDIQLISKKMAERRENSLHGTLKPLREKAFAVLEGYSQVLVSLSSGEPTEAIITEANGLIQDINGVLETAGKLTSLTTQSQSIARFTGPLAQYVGVLNEVIRMVSDMIRERAITKTIGKANEAVIELLTVLKDEAVLARDNTLLQMKNVRQSLSEYLNTEDSQNSDNVFTADIAKRVAEITAFEKQIMQDENDTGKAFDAAIKAQKALFRKALLDDQADWEARIRDFREKVQATRDAMEKIRINR